MLFGPAAASASAFSIIKRAYAAVSAQILYCSYCCRLTSVPAQHCRITYSVQLRTLPGQFKLQ
jgi:hypothetical protein